MIQIGRLISRGRGNSASSTFLEYLTTALQPLQDGPIASNIPSSSNITYSFIHSSRINTNDEGQMGPKAVLRSLLSNGPLTSEELWEHAQQNGLKSKRFMKKMLQQMRQNGEISTSPPNNASENQSHHGHGSLKFVYSKTN